MPLDDYYIILEPKYPVWCWSIMNADNHEGRMVGLASDIATAARQADAALEIILMKEG